VVTTDTVAALLTILGYSLYDTIIVFDRVRENIPRMPRAAFSQIVNRSMSEVLTRSLATTSCTLLPIIALLIFGGSTLKDFAFALLIGVASGAYSSIFIASPVLTHWKEREIAYRHRRERIESEFGYVPAYAAVGGDVEPSRKAPRRTGRLTTPDADNVSAAEFEQMKRELGLEEEEATGRRTSTLSKRLAHTREEPKRSGRSAAKRSAGKRADVKRADVKRADGKRADGERTDGKRADGKRADGMPDDGERSEGAVVPPRPEASRAISEPEPAAPTSPGADEDDFVPAPDIAENEGVAPVAKGPAKPRSRNRRHGRRR
jgi:SecD/SecF fusion protein